MSVVVTVIRTFTTTTPTGTVLEQRVQRVVELPCRLPAANSSGCLMMRRSIASSASSGMPARA